MYLDTTRRICKLDKDTFQMVWSTCLHVVNCTGFSLILLILYKVISVNRVNEMCYWSSTGKHWHRPAFNQLKHF